MKKVYRKSFWSARATKVLGVMIIIFVILAPYIWNNLNNAINNGVSIEYIMCISLIFMLVLILVVLFILMHEYFYVEINDEYIVIRNGVFSIVESKFKFCWIDKVVLGNAGGLSCDYIQIYYNNKKSIRYVIDLVDYKDYNSMLLNIQKMDIQVEKIGFIRGD